MTTKQQWNVGDTYFQAQLFRHGRGLDYDCPPRETKDEAESDLQDSLGMMSPSERERSESESFVSKYEVLALDPDGTIGAAKVLVWN